MTRTFENKVVFHPEDYQLTYADLADLRFGEAYYIAGPVLAFVETICEHLSSQEGYWFYTAAPEQPEVITGLHLPAQSVSSAGCRVEPAEVIRSVRAVRARGETIVAAGHSHGLAGVSVSLVDESEHETLAQEGAGWRYEVKKTLVGEAAPDVGEDGGVGGGGVGDGGGLHSTVVRFPESPGVSARLSSGSPINADLELSLTVERSRNISSFSTSNARSEHLFAMFERVSCPACGDRSERHIKPREITLHVIGEIEIDPRDRQLLIDRVDEKVRAYAAYGAYTYSGAWGTSVAAPASATPEAGQQSEEPAPFAVVRDGYAAVIPAAVLEEAAARTKALAHALGWEESPPSPDKEGTDGQ